MGIASMDQYIASAKQKIKLTKTASRTSVATIPFTVFDLAGNPGAGTLAAGNTANGVLQTDAITGYASIDSFAVGATGYLTQLIYRSPVLSTMYLFDCLWKGGAYAYSAGTTTLSSQPALSGRCPDYPGSGTVFGLRNEIWVEVTTAFVTGTAWQVQVTYTNSNGTTGRTSIISAAQNAAALTAGKMFQLALQAGDSGVQKIDSVIVTNGGTAMTAGAFNVLIMRPLAMSRVDVAGRADRQNLLDLGMPVVYETSALYPVILADSTATSTPEIFIEIANAA